jgi:hypothetical protein
MHRTDTHSMIRDGFVRIMRDSAIVPCQAVSIQSLARGEEGLESAKQAVRAETAAINTQTYA